MDESKPVASDEGVDHTVWVVGKDGHTVTCRISGEPGQEALQVLVDRDVYLDELHAVHGGAVGRAQTLLHGFEAHGWTPVATSGTLHEEPRPAAIE
jgi:hypothetical protein